MDKNTIVVVIILMVFIFLIALYGPSFFTVPKGWFNGGPKVTRCMYKDLPVIGIGNNSSVALENLILKQERYSHLFCNGKFKEDPDEAAIPTIGCPTCKPHCSPSIIDITAPNLTVVEGEVHLSKSINIQCTNVTTVR